MAALAATPTPSVAQGRRNLSCIRSLAKHPSARCAGRQSRSATLSTIKAVSSAFCKVICTFKAPRNFFECYLCYFRHLCYLCQNHYKHWVLCLSHIRSPRPSGRLPVASCSKTIQLRLGATSSGPVNSSHGGMESEFQSWEDHARLRDRRSVSAFRFPAFRFFFASSSHHTAVFQTVMCPGNIKLTKHCCSVGHLCRRIKKRFCPSAEAQTP